MAINRTKRYELRNQTRSNPINDLKSFFKDSHVPESTNPIFYELNNQGSNEENSDEEDDDVTNSKNVKSKKLTKSRKSSTATINETKQNNSKIITKKSNSDSNSKNKNRFKRKVENRIYSPSDKTDIDSDSNSLLSSQSESDSEGEDKSETQARKGKPVEKRQKVYVNQGIYYGIMRQSKVAENKILPLPMLAGLKKLSTEKPFQLPWNIYCPSEDGPKAKWKTLKKNVWFDVSPPPAEEFQRPPCTCTDTCGEDCLNRMLQYECDPETCPFGEEDCGNRAIQVLAKHVQAGKRFAQGYDVIKTNRRGYGLRAARGYKAGELIIEYTGDVISQKEMQRRVQHEYQGIENYYCLSLEKGYVIDSGLRGSAARFVNHSCDPNCEMQKWYVNGIPRIGLFAGSKPIEPGSELTYDYNFDWFKGAVAQSCHCGSDNCRGVIGKKPSGQNYSRSDSSTPPVRTSSLTSKKSRPSVKVSVSEAIRKSVNSARNGPNYEKSTSHGKDDDLQLSRSRLSLGDYRASITGKNGVQFKIRVGNNPALELDRTRRPNGRQDEGESVEVTSEPENEHSISPPLTNVSSAYSLFKQFKFPEWRGQSSTNAYQSFLTTKSTTTGKKMTLPPIIISSEVKRSRAASPPKSPLRPVLSNGTGRSRKYTNFSIPSFMKKIPTQSEDDSFTNTQNTSLTINNSEYSDDTSKELIRDESFNRTISYSPIQNSSKETTTGESSNIRNRTNQRSTRRSGIQPTIYIGNEKNSLLSAEARGFLNPPTFTSGLANNESKKGKNPANNILETSNNNSSSSSSTTSNISSKNGVEMGRVRTRRSGLPLIPASNDTNALLSAEALGFLNPPVMTSKLMKIKNTKKARKNIPNQPTSKVIPPHVGDSMQTDSGENGIYSSAKESQSPISLKDKISSDQLDILAEGYNEIPGLLENAHSVTSSYQVQSPTPLSTEFEPNNEFNDEIGDLNNRMDLLSQNSTNLLSSSPTRSSYDSKKLDCITLPITPMTSQPQTPIAADANLNSCTINNELGDVKEMNNLEDGDNSKNEEHIQLGDVDPKTPDLTSMKNDLEIDLKSTINEDNNEPTTKLKRQRGRPRKSASDVDNPLKVHPQPSKVESARPRHSSRISTKPKRFIDLVEVPAKKRRKSYQRNHPSTPKDTSENSLPNDQQISNISSGPSPRKSISIRSMMNTQASDDNEKNNDKSSKVNSEVNSERNSGLDMLALAVATTEDSSSTYKKTRAATIARLYDDSESDDDSEDETMNETMNVGTVKKVSGSYAKVYTPSFGMSVVVDPSSSLTQSPANKDKTQFFLENGESVGSLTYIQENKSLLPRGSQKAVSRGYINRVRRNSDYIPPEKNCFIPLDLSALTQPCPVVDAPPNHPSEDVTNITTGGNSIGPANFGAGCYGPPLSISGPFGQATLVGVSTSPPRPGVQFIPPDRAVVPPSSSGPSIPSGFVQSTSPVVSPGYLSTIPENYTQIAQQSYSQVIPQRISPPSGFSGGYHHIHIPSPNQRISQRVIPRNIDSDQETNKNPHIQNAEMISSNGASKQPPLVWQEVVGLSDGKRLLNLTRPDPAIVDPVFHPPDTDSGTSRELSPTSHPPLGEMNFGSLYNVTSGGAGSSDVITPRQHQQGSIEHPDRIPLKTQQILTTQPI